MGFMCCFSIGWSGRLFPDSRATGGLNILMAVDADIHVVFDVEPEQLG